MHTHRSFLRPYNIYVNLENYYTYFYAEKNYAQIAKLTWILATKDRKRLLEQLSACTKKKLVAGYVKLLIDVFVEVLAINSECFSFTPVSSIYSRLRD
ncbi:hypothetical protein BpHYR1_017477 [Brachionus plicatilis]|uniref:Uncharacterized protein n=1 Tax=Brachionus plicatilis TaxID=10195 RepID=A0A3M7PJS2_BRAPC|nr:hypothetical protein BpHYR1_017477 [Brachionus plicatilis]